MSGWFYNAICLVNVVGAVCNVQGVIRYYRLHKQLLADLGTRVPLEAYEQAIAQVLELETRLENETPPPDQFCYIWNQVVDCSRADEMEAWFPETSDPDTRLAREDFTFAEKSHLRFSTRDKKLAMLFKLTWGGAQ